MDQPALWAEWLGRVKKDFPNLDLAYLQNVFSDDFGKFSEAVDLLRSAEVEPMHAKRWTSRHLQPIGSAVLFPDYAARPNGADSLDRRFFRRTGELLYLMMSRSSPETKARLEAALNDRLFSETNHWNAIAKKLQGPDAHLADAPKLTANSIGFLPQPYLARYDRLAEDWISILSHRSIPLEDALDYLMRMSGLNEVVYIAEQAARTSGLTATPVFYLDMMGATQGNHVRTASLENYKRHKNLTKKAIEAYIQTFLATDEWTSLGDNAIDSGKASQLLRDRFLFATSHNPAHPVAKDVQATELLEASANRSHTIGSAFTAHARQIGLLSLKQGVGGWYSPTDSFLEALVIANVARTTEFGEFLRVIYERYGFVVGAEEAKRATNILPAPGAGADVERAPLRGTSPRPRFHRPQVRRLRLRHQSVRGRGIPMSNLDIIGRIAAQRVSEEFSGEDGGPASRVLFGIIDLDDEVTCTIAREIAELSVGAGRVEVFVHPKIENGGRHDIGKARLSEQTATFHRGNTTEDTALTVFSVPREDTAAVRQSLAHVSVINSDWLMDEPLRWARAALPTSTDNLHNQLANVLEGVKRSGIVTDIRMLADFVAEVHAQMTGPEGLTVPEAVAALASGATAAEELGATCAPGSSSLRRRRRSSSARSSTRSGPRSTCAARMARASTSWSFESTSTRWSPTATCPPRSRSPSARFSTIPTSAAATGFPSRTPSPGYRGI